MREEDPACSVIIVNWNTKQILDDCLNSLYDSLQGADEPVEVIVIDNASSDGSAEMVAERFPQTRLITNTENRGFAAANNQGIAIAKARYFLLLNSDTLVLGQAIANSVNYMDEHVGVGVMGCRVLNTDRTVQHTCFRYPTLLNLLLKTTGLFKVRSVDFFCREHMSNWNRDDHRDVDVVTGCFMMVRKSACLEVGTLDEAFFFFGEETDWCLRFKKAGWKVKFAPVGEIVHLGGASSRNSIRRDLMLSQSLVRFHRKHFGVLSAAAAWFILLAFNTSRALIWSVAALFNKAARVRMLHFIQVSRTFLQAWPRAERNI